MGSKAPIPPPEDAKRPASPPPPPPPRASGCSTLAESMASVVGKVGIFGALAVLHDYFDRNAARYETYPVIQAQLRRFDRELRVAIESVDPQIDRELSDEMAAERRYQYEITELIDRYPTAK